MLCVFSSPCPSPQDVASDDMRWMGTILGSPLGLVSSSLAFLSEETDLNITELLSFGPGFKVVPFQPMSFQVYPQPNISYQQSELNSPAAHDQKCSKFAHIMLANIRAQRILGLQDQKGATCFGVEEGWMEGMASLILICSIHIPSSISEVSLGQG